MKEQMIVSINKNQGLVKESQGGVDGLGSVPKGCMRLSGVFGVTGVMNNNQRYYTNENYKQMVESLSARINSDGVFGELEHPNTMNVDLSKVTHKVESISIDESTGVVSGTILLLNNTRGREIQTLVENGLKLKISSRGRGTVSESGEVKLSMLETYDLVYKPGFSQAQLSLLTESVSPDGNLVLETLVSPLDNNGNVIVLENDSEKNDDKEKEEQENKDEQKQTTEMKETEKKLLKESLKSEILNELKLDIAKAKVVEKADGVDVDAISDYITEVVNNSIAESEKKTQNHIHESMLKFGKATQKFLFESFAPDVVRYLNESGNLVTNEKLETTVQKVQEWAITDLAQGIQSWSINEFAEDIEAYFKKSDSILEVEEDDEKDEDEVEDTKAKEKDTDKDDIDESSEKDADVNSDDEEETEDKDVDETSTEDTDDEDETEDDTEDVDESQNDNLSFMEQIDEQLKKIGALESEQNLISESAKEEEQTKINEALKAENFLMENMPESVKHIWESSTEEFKAQVKKQASVREFVNESQAIRFWLNRFTQKDAKEISESQKKETVITENTSSNSLVRFAKMMNS